METRRRTRALAVTAILIAIMLLMGFVPNLGFITIGPISITLMCLPVIIATLTLGLRIGFITGALFAVISISKMFLMPDAFSAMVVDQFGSYGLLYMAALIVPRLVIPVSAFVVSKLMRAKSAYLNGAVASVAGSLTNTFLYLIIVRAALLPVVCAIYSIEPAGADAFIWSVVLSNGLPEAIFAGIVCPAVVLALKKAVPSLNTKLTKENA